MLDGAPLLPAITHTIDTQPGDTGVYLFQCDIQVCDRPTQPEQRVRIPEAVSRLFTR